MAVVRRLLNGRHVADAGQRHVERARDGGRGQGEHIDLAAHFLERFLVGDAEALFLVDNEQAKVVEGNLFVKQLVCADNQVDHTGLQLLEDFFLLRAGLVAA